MRRAPPARARPPPDGVGTRARRGRRRARRRWPASGHAQGDLVNAVAVSRVVCGDLVPALERACEDQADATLLEHVRDPIAAARLKTPVGGLREAERVLEVVGGLGGVADVELDVVDAVHGHAVVVSGTGGGYGAERSARWPCLLSRGRWNWFGWMKWLPVACDGSTPICCGNATSDRHMDDGRPENRCAAP